MKAKQTDNFGIPYGPEVHFPQWQWDAMKMNYGKRLRWVEVKDEPVIPEPEPEPEVKPIKRKYERKSVVVTGDDVED